MENKFDARERINALTLGMKILLPATALLFIDTFLRWQEVCVDLGPAGEACAGQNGWNGFWGVLLGLLTIAMLVWVGLQLANVDLSTYNLPVTTALITLGLGVLIFAIALLKNLVDDYSTIWSYIGVVLAAAVAYGAYQRSRELEGAAPAGFGSGGSSAGTGVGGTTGTTGGGYAGGDVAPPPPPPPTTGGPTSTPGLGTDPTPEAPPDYRPGGTPPPRDEP